MDKKVILFDFDGTVMDGSRCVYKALERSCEEVGVPFPAMERLKGFIGPPIWDSMRVAGFTDDIIPEILTVYRRICGYEEMLKGWRFYDGIPEMLTQLRERGYKLFIVSMRSMPSLREVDGVVHFSQYFDGVFGRMDDDDTTDKAVLTERALKSLNVSRDDCVIIGDSIYDEIGAGNAGIDFVAVTYGFGYTDRSEVNGALAVLDSVGELCDYVEKEFPRMDTDK